MWGTGHMLGKDREESAEILGRQLAFLTEALGVEPGGKGVAALGMKADLPGFVSPMRDQDPKLFGTRSSTPFDDLSFVTHRERAPLFAR